MTISSSRFARLTESKPKPRKPASQEEFNAFHLHVRDRFQRFQPGYPTDLHTSPYAALLQELHPYSGEQVTLTLIHKLDHLNKQSGYRKTRAQRQLRKIINSLYFSSKRLAGSLNYTHFADQVTIKQKLGEDLNTRLGFVLPEWRRFEQDATSGNATAVYDIVQLLYLPTYMADLLEPPTTWRRWDSADELRQQQKLIDRFCDFFEHI